MGRFAILSTPTQIEVQTLKIQELYAHVAIDELNTAIILYEKANDRIVELLGGV